MEKGKKYILYLWNKGWMPLGDLGAGNNDPDVLKKLPVGGLYWITGEEDRETARIFTIEKGKQRFW